jgi:hypothetical protein
MTIKTNKPRPEKGSLWLDYSDHPHHVTHSSRFSVTANAGGRSVNMKTAVWNEEMRPFVLGEL